MTEEMLEELDELSSIEKYIEVLIEKFPEPITQKELAQETSVTKSAISKIRNKVATLCDIKVLGYEKKLLLSLKPETFTKLLLFFINRMKPQVFLRSNYLRSMIKSWNVHEKLSKYLANLSYSDFFYENDTNKIVEIMLYNLSNIRFPQQHFNYREINKASSNETGLLIRFITYFPVLNDLTSNFDVAAFDNEKELINLLRLRDKVFCFIMHNFKKALPSWEVVANIEEDKKATYVEAYLKVVDYYSRKFASDLTSKIAAKAKENGIEFKSQYSEIGSLFYPNTEHNGDTCHAERKGETHLSTPGFGESPLPSERV